MSDKSTPRSSYGKEAWLERTGDGTAVGGFPYAPWVECTATATEDDSGIRVVVVDLFRAGKLASLTFPMVAAVAGQTYPCPDSPDWELHRPNHERFAWILRRADNSIPGAAGLM